MSQWYQDSEQEVIKNLETSLEVGLDDAKVKQLQEKYGPNELPKEAGESLLSKIIGQFEDLLVRILLAAAIISFILALTGGAEEEGITAYVEPFVILLILIANATIGVWQETNAEAALEALKELQPDEVNVLRNGKIFALNARELVPGDIVIVSQGDKIGADCRLVQMNTTTLRVNQSALTGENEDVNKITKGIQIEKAVVQDQKNLLFSGTTVSAGSGKAIVIGIGTNTQIGTINKEVKEAEQEQEDTPLKKKLDQFGNYLSIVIGVICLLVWGMNFNHFFDESHGGVVKGCIYYFKIAVSLAVAAIPEGLPAVITTCLALGTRKMAKKNAIVRKLPSVETLGCTTIICSDKTGTLTTNEMTVIEMVYPGQSQQDIVHHQIEGTSFEPKGDISNFGAEQLKNQSVQKFVEIASICNDSTIAILKDQYKATGAPTEAALKVLVEKIGKYDKSLKQTNDPMVFNLHIASQFKKYATLEFTRDRKAMSVLVRKNGKQDNELLIKGAPEFVVQNCNKVLLSNGQIEPLNQQFKEQIQQHIKRMAQSALRTLALAYKTDNQQLATYNGPEHPAHKQLEDSTKFGDYEKDAIFVGLAAMRDPPRPEVPHSIEICKRAGIRVIMITGDNKDTAEAIAKQVGILEANQSNASFTGQELEAMSDEKAKQVLAGQGGRVFSRTEPKHKRRLVQILLSMSEIVAMTGDGVNDAPALKQASIGVAMGITGTKVAQEASDMVLADDNFATIVSAVEEGRSIYSNTKAFIRYLISSNIGEVASIFLTAMLGIPEGLTSVQLLWVNLVTDGLPATALGFNPPDLDIMLKKPRNSNDPIISGWIFFRYLIIGLYVGIATVGVFIYWYVFYISPDGHSLVTFDQLTHFSKCHTWEGFAVQNFAGLDFSKNPCSYFTIGKAKAMTLSLSVLVVIEMFNACNAISEDGSLLQMPPWVNPWLLLAIFGSIAQHCLILYIPFLSNIFGVTPLTLKEWGLVLSWAAPILLIDEVLKVIGRMRNRESLRNDPKKLD